jgi:hypothetical protein
MTEFHGFKFQDFADSKLILEFVSVFSRFEYALKLDGWTIVKPQTGAVSANWDSFASTFCSHFKKERTAALKGGCGLYPDGTAAKANSHRQHAWMGPWSCGWYDGIGEAAHIHPEDEE